MNRRSFFKFMPAIFVPFLAEPKISGEEIPFGERKVGLSWDSALGLGKYQSHLMTTGNIDGYYFPKDDEYTKTINFPIEGILTINFEKGSEKYYCFNPRIEKIKAINELNSYDVFHDLYNSLDESSTGNIESCLRRVIRYKNEFPKFFMNMVTTNE